MLVSEPKYLVISLRQCPHCGVGGERFIVPVPFGGANHKCSQCGGFVSIVTEGFSVTHVLEDHQALMRDYEDRPTEL
jgi:hypothetical protein